VASVVSSPAAGCASPLDRLGFWGVGGVYGTVNLVIRTVGPHLLLCGAGRRAHQPYGLGAPDRGAFVRARPDSDPLGSGSGRRSN
jgi:hypothetical protein